MHLALRRCHINRRLIKSVKNREYAVVTFVCRRGIDGRSIIVLLLYFHLVSCYIMIIHDDSTLLLLAQRWLRSFVQLMFQQHRRLLLLL